MSVLNETQAERDEELSAYSGRSVEEIEALSIGAPESLRIFDDRDLDGSSYDHLYRAYPRMDSVHYLRTLAALTVARRAKFVLQVQGEMALRAQDWTDLRVLDFGSGVGSHGIHCAERGAFVDFMDVDGPLSQYARWRVSRRGLSARFLTEDAELPRDRYDVVLCLDVLEHVADPVGKLRQLTEALVPGGLLALEVSTMVKPTSGHFARSIARWVAEGPAYLRSNYEHLQGVVHARK